MIVPPPLTPGQVRELDRITIEEFGVPGRLLMEVAGFGASEHLVRCLPPPPEAGLVLVLAGVGNNAGDGFVLARILHCRGYRVAVQLLLGPDRFEPGTDAGANLDLLSPFGIEVFSSVRPRLEPGVLVVDALLGTGLRGAPREPFASAIETVNRASLPVFSLDSPSGLDGVRGMAEGAAIEARWTATFGCPKTGLVQPGAERWVGELFFVPLCFPPEVYERVR